MGMYLTANEISKALNITTEAIRHYVREGLVTPHRNKNNGYWEYSSEDLLRLTDILFYRSMSLTIPEIRAIMVDELPLEEIGGVIERRKGALIAEIRERMDTLAELQRWGELHSEEMRSLGTFRIGAMPPSYRRCGCYDSSRHIAEYLRSSFDFERADWMDLSLSFFYDQNAAEPRMERYLAFVGTARLKPSNIHGDLVVESAPHCLITEAHYSDEPMEMLRPMLDYAAANGIRLSGKFYGQENTNYFSGGQRKAIYCIYAEIKEK